MDPLSMNEVQVCIWIEFLAAQKLSPGTIKNKVSHARVFVRLAGGEMAGLQHLRASMALDAMTRRKDYVQREKGPVPTEVLLEVLWRLPDTQVGAAIRAALLIMYFGAMRQSEVVPPTQRAFDHTRHLTRGDVRVTDRVTINIKWAKNLQRYDERRTMTLWPTGHPGTCPVGAVATVLAATPDLQPTDPLLVIPGSARPLTAGYIRAAWNSILRGMGVAVGQYGLHSIRKAAATNAHKEGCTELEVQRHCGWKSNAYKTYIHTDNSIKVHKALQKSLS